MTSWTDDRRIVRRIMPNAVVPETGWPASIPAVAQILAGGLELAPGVNLLVGENGTGKSTIVEAVAEAFGIAPEGGSIHGRPVTHATESPLHRWIDLVRGPAAPRWGFFLRAETMHGYYSFLADSRSPHDPDFHEMSHGESFLALLDRRFATSGFYCLDEPEAALSFSAQLALIDRLLTLADQGAQVLCATHSPVLAALPGAHISELGPWGIRDAEFESLELVAHYRSYLEQPMRYLRHLG